MMNISIKGLRIPLTEAIKEYVSKKLEPLEKIMTHNAYVHVELGKPSAHHKTGPDAFMAEITIDTNGHVYFARARESDLYAAIDAVTAEIIETGAHARVLRAKLDDGKVVTVPRANVEL